MTNHRKHHLRSIAAVLLLLLFTSFTYTVTARSAQVPEVPPAPALPAPTPPPPTTPPVVPEPVVPPPTTPPVVPEPVVPPPTTPPGVPEPVVPTPGTPTPVVLPGTPGTVTPAVNPLTAQRDASQAGRLSIIATPHPDIPSYGFGTNGAFARLISVDGQRYTLDIDDWDASRVVASTAEVPPAGAYTLLLIRDDSTDEYRGAITIAETSATASEPLPAPTAVVTIQPQSASVTPDTVVEDVAIIAQPALASFDEQRYGPVQLVGGGETVPLEILSGWGTNTLIARVPQNVSSGRYAVRFGNTSIQSSVNVIARVDAITGLTVSAGRPGDTISIETFRGSVARFNQERLGNPFVVVNGRRVQLENVSGWGTNRLTAKVPARAGDADWPASGGYDLKFDRASSAAARLTVINDGLGDALRARYRLEVTGIHVITETYDDPQQWDGKRDEVFFSGMVATVDPVRKGVKAIEALRCSSVYGDANGWAKRVALGSASSVGGIKTGDDLEFSPHTLWEGDLDQIGNAAVVYPMAFEWDRQGEHAQVSRDCPSGDGFSGTSHVLDADRTTAFGQHALSLIQSLGSPQVKLFGPPWEGFALSPSVYLPAPGGDFASSPIAIVRKSVEGHRHIGAQLDPGDQKRTIFVAQPLVLHYTTAEVILRQPLVRNSNISMRFVESPHWLEGNYTLRLKLSKVGESTRSEEIPKLPQADEISFAEPLRAN